MTGFLAHASNSAKIFNKITAVCHKEVFLLVSPHFFLYICVFINVLVELPEEAHSTVNHTSSLRLFSLGAGHS